MRASRLRAPHLQSDQRGDGLSLSQDPREEIGIPDEHHNRHRLPHRSPERKDQGDEDAARGLRQNQAANGIAQADPHGLRPRIIPFLQLPEGFAERSDHKRKQHDGEDQRGREHAASGMYPGPDKKRCHQLDSDKAIDDRGNSGQNIDHRAEEASQLLPQKAGETERGTDGEKRCENQCKKGDRSRRRDKVKDSERLFAPKIDGHPPLSEKKRIKRKLAKGRKSLSRDKIHHKEKQKHGQEEEKEEAADKKSVFHFSHFRLPTSTTAISCARLNSAGFSGRRFPLPASPALPSLILRLWQKAAIPRRLSPLPFDGAVNAASFPEPDKSLGAYTVKAGIYPFASMTS